MHINIFTLRIILAEQELSDEEMMREWIEKNAIKNYDTTEALESCLQPRSKRSGNTEALVANDANSQESVKKDEKCDIKKVKKFDFSVRRIFFLRLFMNYFFDLDTYHRFNAFFEVPLMTAFGDKKIFFQESLNEASNKNIFNKEALDKGNDNFFDVCAFELALKEFTNNIKNRRLNPSYTNELGMEILDGFDLTFQDECKEAFESLKGLDRQSILDIFDKCKNKYVKSYNLVEREVLHECLSWSVQEDFLYPPRYSDSKIEWEAFTTTEKVRKVFQLLVNSYVFAETLRYLIISLQDLKFNESHFDKFVEGIKWYKENTDNVIKFTTEKLYLNLIKVQDADLESIYFFSDIEDKEKKEKILSNTVMNFEKIDDVILDKTLLKDLNITEEEFKKVFKGDRMQKFIENLYDKITNFGTSNTYLQDDELQFEFQIHPEGVEATNTFVEKSEIKDFESASLKYLTKGVLDGLTWLAILEIFMLHKRRKRKRVLAKIEKYTATARNSYTDHLNNFSQLIQYNAHRNVVFIVTITRYLGLSKAQAWKLSESLGLNKYQTFMQHYDEIYELLYPNYKYIKF